MYFLKNGVNNITNDECEFFILKKIITPKFIII